MKKKKSLSFLFYCLIVAAVIIGLLVFNRDDKQNKYNSTDIQTETPNNSADNIPNNNQNSNTESYATELTLNLPETINILINTKIKLLDGFVTVVPTELKSKINLSISSYYTEDLNGLKIDGLTLTALKADTYKLNVSVPKKIGNITKSVIINVYEEKENSHISQIKNNATIGENLSIDTYFNIKNNADYILKTDTLINFTNNEIIPIKAGTSNLTFEFESSFVTYIYNFNLTIKNQPEYYIKIIDLENNTLIIEKDNTTYGYINYSIKNREEESVNQAVIITIDDESIVVKDKEIGTLIKIKAMLKGTTYITITCVNDPTIFTVVTVIVK